MINKVHVSLLWGCCTSTKLILTHCAAGYERHRFFSCGGCAKAVSRQLPYQLIGRRTCENRFLPSNSPRIKIMTDKSYFVIGVSGVTCGGKTTLSKLLEKSFPWCHIMHQDTYFYEDDYANHIRMGPEVQNHVNYELMDALNMPQMHKDVLKLLDGPGELHEQVAAEVPNFDTGAELVNSIKDINYDTSKYSKIPIVILEGFIIYASGILYDKCDVRFFMTLPEEECKNRRNHRTYVPPDVPGYFEQAIWPEYVKHVDEYVAKRQHGIKVFEGTTSMENILKQSLDIITCRLEEKYFERK